MAAGPHPDPAAGPAAYPSSTSSTTATPSASPTGVPIEFTGALAPTPAELAGFYEQSPAWLPCDDEPEQECAKVNVPLDYARPKSDVTTIALRKVPASKPASRRGTLFINPGGPGSSGIEFALEAEDFFESSIREVYDIVGFDPRGVGESSGFECVTDDELDAMYGADPTPDTPAETASIRSAERSRAAGCLRRGGELARHMGTDNVARDLDILRAAVDDDRLNYFGISYGTLLGAIYVSRFPSRVGLMVLDSAVSSDDSGTTEPNQVQIDVDARRRAQGLDLAFDDFASECVDAGSCALGDDVEAVRTSTVRLLDALEKRPLPSTEPGIPRLTEGWAATALRLGIDDPDSWTYLTEGLAAAIDQRDGSGLAFVAAALLAREDGHYLDGYERSHLPIQCADWPVTSWETTPPSRAVMTEYPLYARLRPIALSECQGWTGTIRASLAVEAEASTPVIIINNTEDPVTPMGEALSLSRSVIGSVLVEVDNQGHGAYSAGNACANRVVVDYLVRALAPAPDTRC